MEDIFTVAVRMPVAFGSAAEMAGWLERAVANAMKESNWTGTPYVIFRDEKGRLRGFMDGAGMSTIKKMPWRKIL